MPLNLPAEKTGADRDKEANAARPGSVQGRGEDLPQGDTRGNPRTHLQNDVMNTGVRGAPDNTVGYSFACTSRGVRQNDRYLVNGFLVNRWFVTCTVCGEKFHVETRKPFQYSTHFNVVQDGRTQHLQPGQEIQDEPARWRHFVFRGCLRGVTRFALLPNENAMSHNEPDSQEL